jgi:four helix bundle protein
MQDFKNLTVWQKSHTMTLAVYHATAAFPKDEQFALTSQIRRACYSIPTNIAEGCGRGGNGELSQFLKIALGSANELEYELLLAKDLAYIEVDVHENLNKQVNEIKGMLISLIKKVSLKT